MKDGEQKTQGETFEQAKAALDDAAGPEVTWDKNAPTGPPTPAQRSYPSWFSPIFRAFQEIIADEAPLVDLCLEKAIEIVQFNHDRGLVGSDYFPEASGGNGMTPNRTSMVAMSIPLAVEFYKQCVMACNTRTDELKVAFNEAMALRADEEKKKIVVTGT